MGSIVECRPVTFCISNGTPEHTMCACEETEIDDCESGMMCTINADGKVCENPDPLPNGNPSSGSSDATQSSGASADAQIGAVSADTQTGAVSGDSQTGAVTDDTQTVAVSGDTQTVAVSGDTQTGAVSADLQTGGISGEDRIMKEWEMKLPTIGGNMD